MRKVEILKPIDGYAKGDTPVLPGPKVRELVESGHAKRLPKDDETTAKPARKRN